MRVGVFVRSEASDVHRVALRDNDVTASGTGPWTVGVQVAPSRTTSATCPSWATRSTAVPACSPGLGAPTDRVGGNAGDVFQRLDGDPGPKLFVKEPGDATTHGWAAK